jgi:hypothetical protein
MYFVDVRYFTLRRNILWRNLTKVIFILEVPRLTFLGRESNPGLSDGH